MTLILLNYLSIEMVSDPWLVKISLGNWNPITERLHTAFLIRSHCTVKLFKYFFSTYFTGISKSNREKQLGADHKNPNQHGSSDGELIVNEGLHC